MNISEMSTKLRLRSLSWREMARTVKRLIHQLAELPVMDLLISERYFGAMQSSSESLTRHF